MRVRRIASVGIAVGLVATVPLLTAATVRAPQAGRGGASQSAETTEIQIVPVQGHISMLVGAGPNLAVQVGDQGALVVDTGPAAKAAQVLAAVRRLNTSGRPLQFIINTSFEEEHNGGNGVLSKSGRHLADPNEPAPVLASEEVQRRMTAPTGSVSPRQAEDWPTDTYFDRSKELYFNGEPVQIFHEMAAHTDGDSIVFFRHSDVIATGDIFLTTTYPVIDVATGGTVNGEIAALNHVLELTIPAAKQEGGTLVIPGHGRLCDEADVAVYRDMVTIVRDRIQDAVKKGMSLAQVKASTVTLEYDARYGMSKGPGGRDAFIEAVYKTVGTQLKPDQKLF